MKPIRLLALDLDNTLLRSDLTISFRTRNALKKADAAGVTIAFATRRAPRSTERFSKLLGGGRHLTYLICDSGALVMESQSGERLIDDKIDTKSALAVCDLADAEGFAIQIYEDDIMYLSKENEFTQYSEKITGVRQVVLQNFRDLVSHGCRKMLIPGDPMLLGHLETLMRTYMAGEITILSGRKYLLEILPKGTDKGTALAHIAEKIGVGADETCAIGDAASDTGMIQWAGMGVAMLNGEEVAKKAADIVTKHRNDDDGVAEIIEQYILTRE
jgi:Cof subfamily protein (haloacid dehalogenase superfamily)